MNDRHAGEELNRRSLYLRILRLAWIIPAAAVIGGVLFGLLYTLKITMFSGQRQYKETSKYYIDFAFNDDLQKAYDYYNAATWDDVLYAHPIIAEHIEAALPADMTMEEAKADTEALVISDIRLLTVEVTAVTPEKAEALTEGIKSGLEAFGKEMKEFEQISFLSAEGPVMIVVSDRTENAVLLGAVLGLLIGFFGLLIRETVNDGIYVPEEAERRYGLPVLGVTAKKGTELPSLLKDRLTPELLKATESGEQVYKLPSGEAVILLRYATGSGSAVENLLSRLSQEGATVKGIILTDADGKFLRRYYKD